MVLNQHQYSSSLAGMGFQNNTPAGEEPSPLHNRRNNQRR